MINNLDCYPLIGSRLEGQRCRAVTRLHTGTTPVKVHGLRSCNAYGEFIGREDKGGSSGIGTGTGFFYPYRHPHFNLFG